jgi:hypothetical protein
VSEIRTRSHIVSHDTDNPYLVPRHFRQLLWIRNVKNISFPFTADNKLTDSTKSLWIHIQAGLWALKVHRCYHHIIVNRALLRAHISNIITILPQIIPSNTMQHPLCVSVCWLPQSVQFHGRTLLLCSVPTEFIIWSQPALPYYFVTRFY